MKNKERMLEGSLFKGILLFSIPLMVSNLLQVLFNISDLAVVGKFSGPIALGAVGSTSMLVTLYLGFVLGFGQGIEVLVARYLGSKEDNRVKAIVGSGFTLSIIYGFIIMIIAISTAYPILLLLKTKPELINDAFKYLVIFFLGLPALTIFNYGNGVLAANGDTKRPLLFLSIAGIINVLLNLFLVIVCHMGVEGVAISSAISQYISAICIIIVLLKEKGLLKLNLKEIKPDKRSIKEILRLGIPTGFQYAIFAIANMFLQSGINSFEHETVEGVSAATNADSIIYESMYAFYTACAAFMSKNFGAMKKDRVLKSYFISLFYSFLLGLILGGLLYFFGRYFLKCFTDDEIVITEGLKRIKVMGFSYCISSFMDCTTAACRGLGKTIIPTIIVICGSCIYRIIWLYTIFYSNHYVEVLFLVYITSWIITSIPLIIYFIYIYNKQMSIFKKTEIQSI